METIQFRRGPRAEYNALPDRDKDENDFYIVGGNGEPLTMYIGDEMVQDVIDKEIVVTSDFGLYETGDTIRPGTPVTEVLKNMLCKEMFPTFKVPTASISAYSEAPSGNEFVGDYIKIPKLGLSIVSGLFVSEWPQPTPRYNTSTAILNASVKGFEGYSTGSENVSFSDTSAIINSQSVTITSGINSLTVGGAYRYDSPTNNPVSNLKNECPGCKWQNGTAIADKKTISCTGVYRIYSNAAVENPDGDGEQAVLTAVNTKDYPTPVPLRGKYDNWTINNTFVLKLGFSQMVAGLNHREIHLPENVKIESQYGYGLAGYDLKASFNPVGIAIYDNIVYNRFIYANETIGANTFQITCKVYDKNQYIY